MQTTRQKRRYYNWDNIPVLLSLQEASVLLQVTPECIRKYCISGKLPAIQIGKSWHVDRDALMHWLHKS